MNNTVTITSQRPSAQAKIIPIMFCFFAMGFVDLVGTASNYVQKDLSLTDAQANIFPSLVFFWFLMFSVPTGLLMNRIGRKRTVMVSLTVTLLSLIVPFFFTGYMAMLIAFSLLGIGNALMQTSLNPLVSNLIIPSRLASALTFGQFVKAIASFLAPIICAWGVTTLMPTLGLGWRVLFPIYAAVCLLSLALLGSTPIREERHEKASSVKSCFKLLSKPFILLCFLGIMCHVGIDVGTNTTAPKLIMERLDEGLETAGYATSVYFIFRTIGCLSGSFVLQRIKARIFMGISVAMMITGGLMLISVSSLLALYIGIGLIGFGNSNVFSMILAQAINSTTTEKNEVSGLMIMGLFGGTVFPLAMGLVSDAVAAQWGAVLVMLVGMAYLVFFNSKMKQS